MGSSCLCGLDVLMCCDIGAGGVDIVGRIIGQLGG